MSFLYSFESHWTLLGGTSILAILLLNLLRFIDFKIVNKDGDKLTFSNDELKFYLSILLTLVLIGAFFYNTF
jgi:hypothetical protein